MPDVDLVINCYERTYRDVLKPGFARDIAESMRFPFAEVTVLVNNVTDPLDAAGLAADLLAEDAGVTRIEWVADHLRHALATTGLRPRHLRHLQHFTDCCLVAACLPGPEWLCYWDADARMREPVDWITPCIDAMDRDPRHVIGNPDNWHDGLAVQEALRVEGDIAVGYSLSDVAFLARRRDLAAPIYREVAPASWRFALAHVEPVWEQRVDAWMRRERRTRVTYLPARYDHISEAGGNYPRTLTPGQRVKRKLIRHAVPLAGRLSAHPAMRTMP